ncbi:hypothetical protein BX666DRAFT_1376681 [Dichotomocladium elegans]|nr:hypothetical protein BX666DRAFT_1376681 [Dichotomocladium elegans]
MTPASSVRSGVGAGHIRPPASPALSRSSGSRPRQTPVQYQHQHQPRRAPSVASTQSGQVSVRTTPIARPPSASSTITKGGRLPPPTARIGRPMFDEEPFDPHVNPWAQQPPRRYRVDDGHSVNDEQSQQQQQQPSSQLLQSPYHGSSAASSMTATPTVPRAPTDMGNNQLLTEQQYTSVVALGPATKRALDTLQAEIVALNERIDGLRQELIERNQQRRMVPVKPRVPDEDDSDGLEGWKWVVKAALKHAAVNLLMALIMFIALYKRKSPIAKILV